MIENEFPALIRELYAVVARLTAMFPGRHLTPDGHLVGSLGEALAKHYYGIELAPASPQGTAVALSSGPEHLLVLKLLPDGCFEEHYNEPGRPVWDLLNSRKTTKSGQQQIRLSVLCSLVSCTDPALVLEPVRPLPENTRRNPAAQVQPRGVIDA